jgi:hypothetical protein
LCGVCNVKLSYVELTILVNPALRVHPQNHWLRAVQKYLKKWSAKPRKH